MLDALLTSTAPPQWVRICTDGRTDGLTQSRGYFHLNIPVSDAHETQADSTRCRCSDKRTYCPRTRFLRWF